MSFRLVDTAREGIWVLGPDAKTTFANARMAEILGCGLPVLANDGVGDVARIIREYRVGVLAQGPDPQAMATAWSELTALLEDPDLASRCRKAAEEVFSLEAGTASYARLYYELIDGDQTCAG